MKLSRPSIRTSHLREGLELAVDLLCKLAARAGRNCRGAPAKPASNSSLSRSRDSSLSLDLVARAPLKPRTEEKGPG